LNERFGEGPMFDLGGMALTSQAIGPKILWMQRREPEVLCRGENVYRILLVHGLQADG
jgi:xylulokinase